MLLAASVTNARQKMPMVMSALRRASRYVRKEKTPYSDGERLASLSGPVNYAMPKTLVNSAEEDPNEIHMLETRCRCGATSEVLAEDVSKGLQRHSPQTCYDLHEQNDIRSKHCILQMVKFRLGCFFRPSRFLDADWPVISDFLCGGLDPSEIIFLRRGS